LSINRIFTGCLPIAYRAGKQSVLYCAQLAEPKALEISKSGGGWKMAKTYCPNCDAVISIDKPKMSATVRCRECDTQLEVISIDPFEVDFPLDYEEDWGDDSDEGW
jgi:alpha-aminoadipate carrier protein LysW